MIGNFFGRDGDVFWGGFTLSFVALPMLSSLIIHCCKKWKGTESNLKKPSDQDIPLDEVVRYANIFKDDISKIYLTICRDHLG